MIPFNLADVFPLETPGGTIAAPHPEWVEHRTKWRWLLDSYEGGDAYRFAVYPPPRCQFEFWEPEYGWIRNLVPHKREWELVENCPPRTTSDYAMRLMRTPVPTFVPEAIDRHLGKIFNQEIRRKGPELLEEFWSDVDGRGSDMDAWLGSGVSALLLALGVLDVVADHPRAPDGQAIETNEDTLKYGLDRCVLSYALPENVVWWKTDWKGEYQQVLIQENTEDPRRPTFVWWSATEWVRYDANKERIGGDSHKYGRVPVVRGMDEPLRPRCSNVAMPRYEALAEMQREYYNRDSELILSDTLMAHPQVQGPEDYVHPDGTVPIGPNWLLPKKRHNTGSTVTYEGFEVLEFPKGGAESIRQNKADLRDSADRYACLSKPAGAGYSDGGTVSQSGISKRLDQSDAMDLLGEIAKVLQRFELRIARAAWAVLTNGSPFPADEVLIEYPGEFDLDSLPELLDGVERFLAVRTLAGDMPETDARLLGKIARFLMPGLGDEVYDATDAEVKAMLGKAAQRQQDMASIQFNALNGGPVDGTVQIGPDGQPVDPSQQNQTTTPNASGN